MQETTRQILQQKLLNNDNVFFSDLIELRRTSKRIHISREKLIKIIRMYLNIIKENVLNGYEHELDKLNGSFEIVKVHISNTRMKSERSKYVYHPRHIFEINFKSKYLSNFGMRFQASVNFKRELDKKLKNINTDYKLKNGVG